MNIRDMIGAEVVIRYHGSTSEIKLDNVINYAVWMSDDVERSATDALGRKPNDEELSRLCDEVADKLSTFDGFASADVFDMTVAECIDKLGIKKEVV